jgi:hypothetical protein
MSSVDRSLAFAVALMLGLGCCAAPAFAFKVFKVDPYCEDPSGTVRHKIQDAVDDAAAYDDADHADYVWISQITLDGGWTNQHIVVNDRNTVIIEGGFFDCTDFDPGTDQTIISGAGNDGGPVFEIIGNSHVYLGNLIIEKGQRTGDDSGGGISFVGSGELDIAQTFVFLNKAGYGGGISVSASGGQAVLKLMHDTTIYFNEAYHSGGGIRLEGEARLFVLESKVAINGNTAAAYGGGIEILGPARADIGSAGGGFGNGVVAANAAANGGGVAVIDNGNGEAVLRVFADASAHPSSIVENRASANGGAIYFEGLADACLFSPHLADNIAEDGAAFYHNEYVSYDTGDFDHRKPGGGVYINDGAPATLGNECGPEPISDLGGTTSCNAGPCNTLSGHKTEHADTTPSTGAAIYLSSSDLIATRVKIRNSTVGSIIRGKGGDTTVLTRCLITDNAVSNDLIADGAVYVDGSLTVQNCTIANNSINGDYVIDFGDTQTATLHDDIFGQVGTAAVAYGGVQTFDAGYIVAIDTAGLSVNANPSIVAGIPLFADAPQGDYHLRVNSPGVDFAPAIAGVDLDGAPGSVNLPQIPNKFGPTDLGAYELQAAFACDNHADAVFCDGFGP